MKALKNIGLSDGEIKVYLSILKLGLISTGQIIKESKLQSSSVYHILDSIIEKGIISFEKKNNKKYYFVASPETLLEFLENKKKKIDKEKKQVENILPELYTLKELTKKPKQETLTFEGWNGVLSAFKEAYKQLNSGTTIYSYTITKEFGGADKKQVRWLINKIRELRETINKKNKKKIVMKIISEKGSEIGIDQTKTTHTKVKFIDKHFSNPAVINIYGNVTIIALWLKRPLAFYIISKEVAESFRNNFELLWQQAK